MKKIICICFSILLLTGCEKTGKRVNYSIERGSKRIIFTKDYIIIDTLRRYTFLGDPLWEFDKTISRSDSIACNKLSEEIFKK